MKILTLLLALFLTWMPESVFSVKHLCSQDVCLEQVTDSDEEEAVIQVSKRPQKKVQAAPRTIVPDCHAASSVQTFYYSFPRFCFARQWLIACTLRL